MPLSSPRLRVTVNTLAVGSLLACSDATSPSRPEILATVPVAGRGGSPPASASVQFWLYTHSFPADPGSASLFRSRTIHEGDEGDTLVANAENESDFTAFAALVTNGVDEPVGYLVGATGGGSGSITMLESRFFVGKPGTGPDLSGYTVDSVELVIDAVSIASPGSDPNHDGIWTDYDFAGRVVVWGHR